MSESTIEYAKGNLWDYPADWRCITTNGDIRRDGCLVMGRGCAYEAAQRYPGLQAYAGARVAANGNVVQAVSRHRLILFPVKDHWDYPARLSLIEKSCLQLADIMDVHDLGRVVMPRPGCGNGRLDWDDVRPVVERILGDYPVTVITY